MDLGPQILETRNHFHRFSEFLQHLKVTAEEETIQLNWKQRSIRAQNGWL
jgi:hypothetical protein